MSFSIFKLPVLVVASVVFVILSFHVERLSWLALVWMVPLALALKQVSPKVAGLLCGVSALGFWVASIWWLLPAAIHFTNVNIILALVIFIVLCAFQALPYYMFGYVYNRFNLGYAVCGPWIAAAALTVFLMVIPSPIPGLPVHALCNQPRLLAVLGISGVSTLLFITTLFQFLIVRALQFKGVSLYANLIQAMVLILSLYGYGYYTNHSYLSEKAASSTDQWITVGTLQPNLRRDSSIENLYDLTRDLLDNNDPVDLIVWPEFPPAYSYIESRKDNKNTMDIVRAYHQDMMVVSGYVYQVSEKGKSRKAYYNTVNLVKENQQTQHYFKQRLVPFFEYLPLRNALTPFKHWFPGTLNYIPGNSSEPLVFNESIKIIPAICYEVIFPGLVRQFVESGGNLLINPVSDTWFGDTEGSRYHLSLAIFRSIEHHIPWLRVANSGISAAVEANGQIVDSSLTSLNTVSSAVHHLFIPRQRTLYSRSGDWLSSLLVMILIGVLICRAVWVNTSTSGKT